MLISVLIVLVALALAACLLFSRKLAASSDWKAMFTPLACLAVTVFGIPTG